MYVYITFLLLTLRPFCILTEWSSLLYSCFVYWRNDHHFFRSFVCLNLLWRWTLNYQEESVLLSLTGLTPPHIWACSKQGPGFPMSFVVVLFVFNDLRWERIVPFLDFGRFCGHSNTTGLTSGAGTGCLSGAYEFTRCFSGVHFAVKCFVDRYLSFFSLFLGLCVVCPSGFRLLRWYLLNSS
jgi:hypothetical protein